MDSSQQPQQRELVYCHQCENEWYRDEHGIICPECQSDFTEIIEAGHDPRADDDGPPPLLGGHHGDFDAPDPDEGDIDDFHWHNNGPGQPPGGRFTGTMTRNFTLGPNGQTQGAGGLGGGLMGLLAPALQGILGGGQQRQQPPGNGPFGQQEEADRGAPGSPRGEQGGNGGTFIRHGSGPGYSFTITTSSNSNLFPRDANGPQPFQNQPDNIERMMAQMMMNIGAMPGQGFGGMRAAPGGPVFMGMGGGPMGGAGRGGPGMGLNDLFQILGGGQAGDAVYSQEALDRIITQLMEQHQSGNAPGPASAEAIDSLPKRPIGQKDLGDSGKADCSICMDEAELGATVTELPCGHWFHHDCIKAWLGEHDTCPHCRQGIMPKDQPNNDRPRQPSQAPHNDMHSPEYQRSGSVPGEYPFPPQNGGEGSSQGNDARRNGGSAGGIFGRMREAFSPGGGNNPSNNNNGADRNTPGR